jgi:hypothetical protein
LVLAMTAKIRATLPVKSLWRIGLHRSPSSPSLRGKLSPTLLIHTGTWILGPLST